MRNRLLAALVAALVVPSMASAWGAKGDTEPSTALDRSGGYMHATSNTQSVPKVYFNGFGGQPLCYAACVDYTGVSTMPSLNPNSAALGSGFQAYPFVGYAMLGVWRDCNDDGYVGLGDQGLLEYPASLGAHRASICPVEAIPNPIPRNWMPVHNDGMLVREFLPIGYESKPQSKPCPVTSGGVSGCGDVNPFDINDSAARVWADWGKPGDQPGRQCYVTPHPQGTWRSAGGATDYADCFANNRIRGAAEDANQEPLYAQLQSVKNPWGETSDGAYVDAFDCNRSNQAFRSDDAWAAAGVPAPVKNAWLNVSHPKGQPTTSAGGSMAGTLNETSGELDDCRDNNRGDPAGSDLPYSTEDDLRNLNGPRDQHDLAFRYNEGVRTAAPVAVYRTLGPSTPEDGGLGLTRRTDLWETTTVTGVSRNPYVDRDNVQPMPVTYVTFYAHLGSDAIVRYGLTLPGSPGKYGAEACPGGIGTGKPDGNFWVCDPDLWWPLTPGGKKTTHTDTINGRDEVDVVVRVGQPYQLRDVDCWDESVTALREGGVSYGVLSGTACA